MSGLLAALSLWAVMPCGPLNTAPHPEAEPDNIEFCTHLKRAYSALLLGAPEIAKEQALLAEQVILHEWETSAHWLIIAEADCRLGNFEEGLKTVDEFLCYADIDTRKYYIEDWWSRDRKSVIEQISKEYLIPKQSTARPEVCFWALEDAFPNDFDQATEKQKNALYKQAYRIKDLCTRQDK